MQNPGQDTEKKRLREILKRIGSLAGEEEPDMQPETVRRPEMVAVSMEQAAALMSVAPGTLKEYVDSGQVRTLRIGRRRLVRLESLKEFAAELEEMETERRGPKTGP